MRSNKTFQPESLKIEPDLVQEPERINADTISQISVDYAHHMKNKKRIADLIKMLHKGGANADIEDVDIQIGDSISNIDAVSQSQEFHKGRGDKLQVYNFQNPVLDEQGSTKAGTNYQGTVKNLAQYKHRSPRNSSFTNAQLLDGSLMNASISSNHKADRQNGKELES